MNNDGFGEDEKVEAAEQELDKVNAKMQAMEARIEARMEEKLGDSRPTSGSTDSRTTTASSRASSQDLAWRPFLVHCRGATPFGCRPGDKHRKQEIAPIQAKIFSLCDADSRRALTPWWVGGGVNHNVSFRRDGEYDARDISDQLDYLLTRNKFKIEGKDIRISVGTAPTRRQACTKYCKLMGEPNARISTLAPGLLRSSTCHRGA